MEIEGHAFVRNDQENALGGGVDCYIKIILDGEEGGFRKGPYGIYLDRNIHEKCTAIVCVLYRSPDTSKYLNQNFEYDLRDMINVGVSETVSRK